MLVACLVTLLALGGVGAGVLLHQEHGISAHLAAAGGGLLFGISLFWLMPEISEASGRGQAVFSALAVAGLLTLLDRLLIGLGHSPRHGVVAPLIAATAIHSLLDGWSMRAFAPNTFAGIAVPVGLALHKIPEGLALGWITRRSVPSTWKAIGIGTFAELFTLAGAWFEPHANQTGSARFGAWWTSMVLSVIAGAFLFLGFHAILPNWRNWRVVIVFFATFALVGGAGLFGLSG